MKSSVRSLLAFAAALSITLALSGCGSDFHPRFAYLQNESAPAVVNSTNALSPHALLQSRRSARPHVGAAARKLGRALSVNICSGNEDVYLQDASGHNKLLAAGYDIFNVQLSSDGTKIVVTACDPDTGYIQVYLGDSRLNTVTKLTSDDADHYDATFSPDGATIAYDIYNHTTDYDELYTVPAAGGTPTMVPITGPVYDVIFPSFTPDGLQLVYSAYDNATDSAVVSLVNLDGSNPDALTFAAAAQWDLAPSVSADGNLVTFTRATGDFTAADIAEIPITGEPGAGATLLTDDGVSLESKFLDSQILFLSLRDGPMNIYQMDSDGSNPTRLTTNNMNQYFNLFLF